MIIREPIVVCGCCNGTGTITYRIDIDVGDFIYETVECPECEGMGYEDS